MTEPTTTVTLTPAQAEWVKGAVRHGHIIRGLWAEGFSETATLLESLAQQLGIQPAPIGGQEGSADGHA